MKSIRDITEHRTKKLDRAADAWQEGFDSATEYWDRLVADLLATNPATRRLYFAMVEAGYAPALPPTLADIVRGVGA